MYFTGNKARSTTPAETELHQPKHLTLKEEPEMIPNAGNTNPIMKRVASLSILPTRDDEDMEGPPPGLDKRRVSWAFEKPEIPSCADPTLDDMKTLLKKQIRGTAHTPDFIYLTVGALKNQVMSTYPYEYSNNPEFPKPQRPGSQLIASALRRPILKHRPQSSPSSIDTKTKVRISDGMAEFLEEHVAIEDGRSMKSGKTSGGKTSHSARSGDRLGSAPLQRAQSAQIFRVQSAGAPRSQSAGSWRAKTAKKLNQKKYHGLTTTATETSMVPMLMYPQNVLKPSIDMTNVKKWPSQESIAKNHPLCSDNTLKLRTYTQEMQHMKDMRSTTSVKS